MSLRWSWLATPYLVCATVVFAVALAGALTRGDRVLRLGVIGAAITALPWTICQSVAACTDDPTVAWRMLRLGQGPVALVGPNLMLVLLGASGQLERYRWIARVAGVTGMVLLVVCWTTTWTVPGVQVIPSGMFYIRPGPLTGVHVSQLVLWLVIGLVIARRAAPQGERKRTVQILLAILVFAAIGSFDSLLLYRIWGFYPIAWLPATIAASLSLYLVVRTDFLRPQGFDRAVALELGFSVIAFVILAILMYVVGPSLSVVVLGAVAWAACSGVAWGLMRARPVRVTGERALEQFVARAVTLEDEAKIAERLGALWRTTILGLELRTLWWRDGTTFTAASGERWTIEPDVMSWFVHHSDALAVSDLATMKVGPIRDQLEAMTKHAAGEGAVIVPLIDRDELVGVVEAHHRSALRESERGMIANSARAAARALTFVGLSRAASRERETAREVEVADALRRQASASRDAELGRWAVAAEYRTAPRTTGAGWSAIELVDGRLALLVTEAQSHGVAGALATAALTGAFAAATAPYAVSAGPTRGHRASTSPVAGMESSGIGLSVDIAPVIPLTPDSSPSIAVPTVPTVPPVHERAPLTLDALIIALRASSEGVLRGGEPVAAFLALLDAVAQTIEFTCAGHPGGFKVGPIATIDGSLPMGSRKSGRPTATALGGGTREPDASMSGATRQTALLPPDTLVVVASTALRGSDDARWELHLQETAPASGRLASVLVELALKRGEPSEDLLAVVVRAR